MGPTETLASYIARASFEDFPTEVVLQAKHCVQDWVGCALGGAQTELGQRHIGLAKELGGKAESSLMGDGTKISCVFAAHANAELGNVLDFDDTDWWTGSHPGTATIGSAFAVGEKMNASGKDVLTAVLVGYEVGLRIGRAIRSIVTLPDGKKETLSNPSFIVFASVAAASKLLGLRESEIVNAFGIAGSTPINRGQSRALAGGAAHPYAENKYNMGIYTLMGVLSSLRGRKLLGDKNILDGDRFWRGSGANTCDHAELTRGLGKEFRIMEIAFKEVSFGGVVAAPVTAVRQALQGQGVKPEDIEEIRLAMLPKLLWNEWETMIEAEFSTPAAVAMVIAGGEPGPAWFTSGRFKDPDILQIASKVKFVEDPKAREANLRNGQYTCTAEIRTRDGKIRKAHVDHGKGCPENPLSEDELHHKFRLNSKGLLGEKRTEALWDTLLHLDTVPQLSTVAPMFARKR